MDATQTHAPPPPPPRDVLERRLRRALWCFFAGDALAAPTHWYYGGWTQVRADYGPHGITDYTPPVHHLAGSILNRSDPDGGGRSGGATTRKSRGDDDSTETTVVGDVILHGKVHLWHPSRSVHYHATLHGGETTLEATLGRVLLRSLTVTGGTFDAHRFRRAYVDFMRTPGSHNDAYASTCHRMFFANLAFHGKSPDECPDNDQHNVDTVDGLVLSTLAALAAAASSGGRRDGAGAGAAAAACAAVTRKSTVLAHAAAAWGDLVGRALLRPPDDDDDHDLESNLRRLARELKLPPPRPRNRMTACYLNSALPALMDGLVLYRTQPVWEALLANANTGGENVHRGSCLGAVLGLYRDQDDLPERLSRGLYHYEEIAREIDAFVEAVLPSED